MLLATGISRTMSTRALMGRLTFVERIGAGKEAEPFAVVRNMQVADSQIDKTAQLTRSEIPRHNPGQRCPQNTLRPGPNARSYPAAASESRAFNLQKMRNDK
jgi:hypothetical protein